MLISFFTSLPLFRRCLHSCSVLLWAPPAPFLSRVGGIIPMNAPQPAATQGEAGLRWGPELFVYSQQTLGLGPGPEGRGRSQGRESFPLWGSPEISIQGSRFPESSKRRQPSSHARAGSRDICSQLRRGRGPRRKRVSSSRGARALAGICVPESRPSRGSPEGAAT